MEITITKIPWSRADTGEVGLTCEENRKKIEQLNNQISTDCLRRHFGTSKVKVEQKINNYPYYFVVCDNYAVSVKIDHTNVASFIRSYWARHAT